jgi:Cysteine-rich CPCC
MGRFTCPSCGYLAFTEPLGSYEFCPVCGWQDDLFQLRFPNLAGGANRPCLIDAQRNYATLGTSDPQQTVRSALATAFSRDPDWQPIDASRDRSQEMTPGEIGDTYERDSTIYYYWRARS